MWLFWILFFGFIYSLSSRVKNLEIQQQELIEKLQLATKRLSREITSLRQRLNQQPPSTATTAYTPEEAQLGQKPAVISPPTSANDVIADQSPTEPETCIPSESCPDEPTEPLTSAVPPSPTEPPPLPGQSSEKRYAWLKTSTTETPADSIPQAPPLPPSPISVADQEAEEPPSTAIFATPSSSWPPTPPPPPDGPEEPTLGERWEEFRNTVDWEQFTGTKLFAWLGGIALFFGAGLFVKYSIDRNLISPIVRLVIGALVGLGMIAASFRFDRERFAIMRQTFTAGGIGVLYSVFFAATLYYEYLAKPAGFFCLVIVSAAAFVLAVFHQGVAISVLGAGGAYATPILVTTGEGGLFSLFLYLAIVNIGLYQVIKRLESTALLLFAVAGTLISLCFGTFFSDPLPTGIELRLAWTGFLLLFTVILDVLRISPQRSRAVSWAGNLLFLTMPVIAVILTLGRPGSSPLTLLTAGIAGAIALALRNAGWHDRVLKYSTITFAATVTWTLIRFDAFSGPWPFLLIFVYGLIGGIGPILLIRRYGSSGEFVQWFRVFPVALGLMTVIIIIRNPNISALFWPMSLGLQIIGIGVSLLFGAVIQVGILTFLLLGSALFWLSHAPVLSLTLSFYTTLLLAGALLCLAIFVILKHLPEWEQSLHPEGNEVRHTTPSDTRLTEWMAATPILSLFILLAAAFTQIRPFNPNPGMAVMLCFTIIALTLTRRLGFQNIGITALFSAVFAQASWMLKSGLPQETHFSAMLWAAGFLLAAMILPFLTFPSFRSWKPIWMSWPIFEVFQGVFLIYAADQLYAREISGWIPLVLAFLKLPITARLVRDLNGRDERNGILACHGGVLLFYVSAVPILLMERGWLGLTLVIEATALLWLNRRVEHPGLRWVATLMAPTGLFILLTNIHVMKSPESLIILNPAVFSVIGAVVALAFAVRLVGFPDHLLGGFRIIRFFQWLTIGTGFYLVNLVIADVFSVANAHPAGGVFQFLPRGDILQAACYAFFWAMFGAVLWRQPSLPSLMRGFGLLLLISSASWLLMFPFSYGGEIGKMAPLFNVALLAYLSVMAVLLYLVLSEPWGSTWISHKNLFLGMLLIVGLLAIKIVKSTIFQPGQPFDLFQDKTAGMAVASAAGWLFYGLALLRWPTRLDRPFRLAGVILVLAALGKAILFPFDFREDFGAMPPLANSPTFLFGLFLAALAWLSTRPHDDTWPIKQVTPAGLWGSILGIMGFYVLNIEIAHSLALPGKPFSLHTRGGLSHQLGYSLGWLLYATGLLLVGIRRRLVPARQAALILIFVTALKVFFKDLWALGQLYRVASFIGLAAIMMFVSYLYQRFLSKGKDGSDES